MVVGEVGKFSRREFFTYAPWVHFHMKYELCSSLSAIEEVKGSTTAAQLTIIHI